MTEYAILYTVDGEGYTRDRPWIWAYADTKEEAIDILTEAEEYLKGAHSTYEVWPEAREISPWRRVDLSAES